MEYQDLFAGFSVTDFDRAVAWHHRLWGDVEAFQPHDTELVWTLGEGRYVYVELQPEGAGGAQMTVFVDDYDGFVRAAAARGVEPDSEENYGNGVRKATYRDPDGNEIGIGGAPVDAA
jgi:hypothetical protein